MISDYPTEPSVVNPGPESNGSNSFGVKVARRQCLDCSGGSPKSILWCPCDGVNSTGCHLWPFRFGVKPASFRGRFGPWLLMPECMPATDVEQEGLPDSPRQAIEWFRERFPEVKWDGPRKSTISPEERERLVRQLNKGRTTAKGPGGDGQEVDSRVAQPG